jgi:tRNA(Ile)-lysidine synthase
MSGLSAIPAKRDDIIRPLIEVTREEILEYLREHGLDYVTDPSNAKPLYTRNRIRIEILPVLKQFNPRIVETLASEASLLRAEEEAAEACLSRIAVGVIAREEGRVVLQREEFNQLPLALRRRLLLRAAEWMGMEPSRLSWVQVDEAVAFLSAALTGRSMNLYDLVMEREYEKLVIRPKAKPAAYSYDIAVPGITAVPDLDLALETLILDGDAAQDYSGPVRMLSGGETDVAGGENYFWQALFDYDKIKPLLKLRNRMPGDWFCPFGMGGKSKKLQDFFVDIRIPRHRRETVPLLTAGDDILWVVGLRTDERFRVGAVTKRTLLVRFRTLGRT